MRDPIPFVQAFACSQRSVRRMRRTPRGNARAPHAALPVEWRTPYYGETRTTVGFVRCKVSSV
jgi:hypothetical protein